MDWRIEFSPEASRSIRKLDRELQRRVVRYLEALIADCDSPRQRGKGLTSQLTAIHPDPLPPPSPGESRNLVRDALPCAVWPVGAASPSIAGTVAMRVP